VKCKDWPAEYQPHLKDQAGPDRREPATSDQPHKALKPKGRKFAQSLSRLLTIAPETRFAAPKPIWSARIDEQNIKTEQPQGKATGMSQIDELNSRITAAMERIGAGVTMLAEREAAAATPDPDLVQALEDEKLANSQLEERLRAIKERHGKELAALRAELDASAELDKLRADLAAQSDAMGRLDMDVQRLRLANEQLRQSNAALRKANESGVGEPHLINKAMLAELESLRALRATDAAEVSAVLAKLEPLLASAAGATDGENV
jgi:chromosome segregation ATPase